MNNGEPNGNEIDQSKRFRQIKLAVLTTITLMIVFAANVSLFSHSSRAEKLSPDQIPPDVVLTPGKVAPPTFSTPPDSSSKSTSGAKPGAFVPGLSTPPSYASGSGSPGASNSQM